MFTSFTAYIWFNKASWNVENVDSPLLFCNICSIIKCSFQEESFQYQDFTSDKKDQDRKGMSDRALWEIKAAILDKAVEKNPNNITLRLAHLQVCYCVLYCDPIHTLKNVAHIVSYCR